MCVLFTMCVLLGGLGGGEGLRGEVCGRNDEKDASRYGQDAGTI